MKKFMLLVALMGCAREAKKPAQDAVCVVTAHSGDGTPLARECNWKGYLWSCDPDACIVTRNLDAPCAEAP